MKDNGSTQNRKVYLDYLRVLATLAVMTIHVSAYNWGFLDSVSTEWRAIYIYDSLSRWCVPAFLMISGAIFLNRDTISIKSIYIKHILRLVVAYIFWSVFYFLFFWDAPLVQLNKLFKTETTQGIISIMNGIYHMWFIPMMIGIYISLPIVKKFAEDHKLVKYFLIVSFIFCSTFPLVIAIINESYFIQNNTINNAFSLFKALYSRINSLNLNLFYSYLFYFLLGYELSGIELKGKRKTLIYIAGLCGTIFTICYGIMYGIITGEKNETVFSYGYINVVLEATAIFVLFRCIDFSKCLKLNKVMKYLSDWSFGAYLIHVFFIEKLAQKGLHSLSFSTIVSIPVVVLTVALCSFAVSAIIHCIPVLKKYIV